MRYIRRVEQYTGSCRSVLAAAEHTRIASKLCPMRVDRIIAHLNRTGM
jgi:hypothetical protein